MDKEGLTKLLGRRGKALIVYQTLQNAWDQNVTRVDILLVPVAGSRTLAELVVEDDDPEGFAGLTHAYTLFAESGKKADPRKRGRFNIGEKLVLALCESASIETTKGGVVFDKKGRHKKRRHREKGSVLRATLRMTRKELQDCDEAIRRLIPPERVSTYYNEERFRAAEPLRVFEAELPGARVAADYSDRTLRFNRGKLGSSFFEEGITSQVMELLIREMAHERAGNHLSEDYHRATCNLGAGLTKLALTEPDLFEGTQRAPPELSFQWPPKRQRWGVGTAVVKKPLQVVSSKFRWTTVVVQESSKKKGLLRVSSVSMKSTASVSRC